MITSALKTIDGWTLHPDLSLCGDCGTVKKPMAELVMDFSLPADEGDGTWYLYWGCECGDNDHGAIDFPFLPGTLCDIEDLEALGFIRGKSW